MPYIVSANGLCNIFTGRKKWTITCGNCHHTWVERVPIAKNCSAVCVNPNCRAQNVWPIAVFWQAYEQQFKNSESAKRSPLT